MTEKPILHVTSNPLGSGTSASVYIAELDGHLVAAKLSGKRASHRRQCRREARRFARLNHPCITRFIGVGEVEETVVLATELMSGGSLFDALANRRGRPLPLCTVLRLAIDVTSALAYMHDEKFSNGDLKSMNVLLSSSLTKDGFLRKDACAKLCDFGLSKRLSSINDGNSDNLEGHAPKFMFESTVDPNANSVAGTYAYLAPEGFDGLPQTPDALMAADIYSLAIVLWEILTAQAPWATISIFRLVPAVTKEHRRPEWPDYVSNVDSKAYISLVEKCWHRNPIRRPSAQAVLRELERLYDDLPPSEKERQPIPRLKSLRNMPNSPQPFDDVSLSDITGQGFSENSSSSESSCITDIDSDDGYVRDLKSFDVPLSVFRAMKKKSDLQNATASDPTSPADTPGIFRKSTSDGKQDSKSSAPLTDSNTQQKAADQRENPGSSSLVPHHRRAKSQNLPSPAPFLSDKNAVADEKLGKSIAKSKSSIFSEYIPKQTSTSNTENARKFRLPKLQVTGQKRLAHEPNSSVRQEPSEATDRNRPPVTKVQARPPPTSSRQSNCSTKHEQKHAARDYAVPAYPVNVEKELRYLELSDLSEALLRSVMEWYFPDS